MSLLYGKRIVMQSRRSVAVVDASDSDGSVNMSGASVYFMLSCVLGPLSMIGIAGNILSIFVLQRDKSGRAMSLLLQALSVGNAVLLLVALFIRIFVDLIYRDAKASSNSLLGRYETFIADHYEYLQPISDAVHMYIVYIVLMIAIERYLAAWKPLDRRHLFTRRRVQWYIALTTGVSLAFNLPKLFVVHSNEVWYNYAVGISAGNLSHNESAKLSAAATIGSTTEDNAIRVLNLVYRSFYALIQHFIPTCVISYCNIRLIGELRKASLFGAKLRNAAKRASKDGGTQHALISPSLFDRGTTLAFATITCYVICETPMAIATLAEMFHNFEFFDAESLTVFYGISIRILDLSACVNLVLYYLFGTKFRTILSEMVRNFWCRVQPNSRRAANGRYEMTLTPIAKIDRSRLNSFVASNANEEEFNNIRPILKSATRNCLTPSTRSPSHVNSPTRATEI